LPNGSRALRGAPVDLFDALLQNGLSRETAEAVARVDHRIISLDPKRPYREPGSPLEQAFFVRSGIVAKYTLKGGRRQILAVRFAGEGMLPKAAANHGLQALVASEVMVVDKEPLDELIAAIPEFALFCVRQSQRLNLINDEWLTNCGSRDTMGRVSHLLCETAVRSGARIADEVRFHNPFTQLQIGEMTGQTSVNVNRVMNDLERQGLIERDGRTVVVSDWSELTRLAGFDAAYLS
jgi:CRP-like cAMP-binding protein